MDIIVEFNKTINVVEENFNELKIKLSFINKKLSDFVELKKQRFIKSIKYLIYYDVYQKKYTNSDFLTDILSYEYLLNYPTVHCLVQDSEIS